VLAGLFIVAWASLALELPVLLGSRGLRPSTLGESSSRILMLGPFIGALLAGAALLRVRPRLCILLTTLLYYAYAAPLAGIWFPPDDLLLECGLLAALLSETEPANGAHLLFRLLLLKLYLQPGIAKLVSDRHDWIDGSAMAHYYEVTPVPARLAWYMHKLPLAWHRAESWFVLAMELVAPLAVFAGRRARLAAAAAFTAFQLLNIATANFGPLAYLSLALNLFLLDDRDLARAAAWLRRKAPAPSDRFREAPLPTALAKAAGVVLVLTSTIEFLGEATSRRLHAFRAYRMFDYVRTERIDPQIQTYDGASWSAQPLRYLPVNPEWVLGYVAPHLPRVDVELGFCEPGRELPPDVGAILSRLCEDPPGVQDLFAHPLPPHPRAARVVFFRDRYTTSEERSTTGAYWQRDLASLGQERVCDPPREEK
jgi:hypothetical protein